MNYKDNPDQVTALLKRWTKPGHPVQGNIMAICVDRLNNHWDTIATNGQVLISFRWFKHPDGIDPAFSIHFESEWFWCFSHIERGECVEPAKRSLIGRVPESVRAAMAADPDLADVEWIRVKRLNYWEHGSRGTKARHKPAPDNVLFFRFNGGLGFSVCEPRAKSGSSPHDPA